MLKTFWSCVAELWCRLMHPAPMWPVHGRYRCRACLREYPVYWEPTLVVAGETGGALLQSENTRSSGNRVVRPAPTW